MANQSASDRKDQTGGGGIKDVTKSEEVSVEALDPDKAHQSMDTSEGYR